MNLGKWLVDFAPLLLAGVFLLGFGGVIIFILRWSRRQKGGLTFRHSRRMHRMLFYILVPLVAFGIYDSLSENKYWFAVLNLFILVPIGFEAFRPPRRKDLLANYAGDPGHCGQCDYDLTGNVSGVCPECGWQIPRDPERIEQPDWAMWWKQWDIRHLENWRAKLALVAFFALAFLALTVATAFFTREWQGIAIISSIMTIAMSINCVRIIAYASRHRHDTPDEAAGFERR